MIQYLADEVIKNAGDHSAGTVVDNEGILSVITAIINKRSLHKPFVDDLIADHESESGYLVRTNDFIIVLDPLLNDSHIDHGCDWDEWKGEKDYELVELLHGDYHTECGDRS